MNGWIKISRELSNHWLWQDANRLKWWLDLIFMAAWEDRKQIVNSRLIEIKRGQLLGSIPFLAERWSVCETTVRKYLVTLEDEEMIKRTIYPKYCVVTICNYDKYQVEDDECVHPSIDPSMHPSNANFVRGNVHPSKKSVKECKSEVSRGVNENEIHPSIDPSMHPSVDPILRNKRNNNIVINNSICQKSDSELEEMFEEFRKAYPGTKRGHAVEFENFKKKNQKTWRETVLLLMPSLTRLLAWRKQASDAGRFVPQYANLSTYINQSRWTCEFEEVTTSQNTEARQQTKNHSTQQSQEQEPPTDDDYTWKGGF
jgi:DNA replication protein DnaD